MTTTDKITPATRDISIDRFRGFIVFCMIFFVGAGDFPCLGWISRLSNKSALGTLVMFKGLTFGDLIDPIFLFILSISYQASFDRRFNSIGNKAYLHFLTRYLCFMGVGSIMVSAEYLFITHYSDPLLIQTILMFVVFAALLVLLLCKLVRPIPKKVGDITKKTLVGSLFILALIGIALGIRDDILIFAGYSDGTILKHWSILHEIGMTGLLVIPFIRLPLRHKIISWSLLTAVYTGLQMLPNMINYFDVVVLGGLMGTLGWLIVMLGGIIMIKLYQNEKKKSFYFALLILMLLSAVTCVFLPMNTSAVTIL